MQVVGVIPARWGSTRLPGKLLIPILGKPLIQWVIERVRQAGRLDAVLVATDDVRIREVVEKTGAACVMTRSDHPSGTDRVAEAVQGVAAEVVINIQGDEPLIDPGTIDRLADVMTRDEEWDMATAAALIESPDDLGNSSVVKVVCGEGGRALYFSRLPIPFIRDGSPGDGAGLHRRHLGIYAYRRSFLERLVVTRPCALEQAEKLEQLRALHIGARIVVIEVADVGPGVDTEEDVRYVTRLLGAAEGAARGLQK